MSMYVEVGYRQPYVNVCRGGLQKALCQCMQRWATDSLMSMYAEVGYREPYVNVCRGGLQTALCQCMQRWATDSLMSMYVEVGYREPYVNVCRGGLQTALCQCLKSQSQVVYSKQPKLGLTQEFVVDCAHALWVVRSIKRLV